MSTRLTPHPAPPPHGQLSKSHVRPASSPADSRLRSLRELPGPPPWPLVGNALQVSLNRIHQNVEDWVKQYGPMIHVRLGGFPLLVISDHELIAKLLRDRPDGFRRPSRMQEIMVEMGIQDGVFVAEGAHWARQRRMVMASFSPGQVRAYMPALRNVAARLQGRWMQAARDHRPIDLQADLMRFTVDAISGLAFGIDVNTLQSSDDVIQRHLDQIFPTIWRRANAIVPYWRWFKLPRDRAVDRGVKAVNEAIRGFIADARGRLQDPARRAAPQNMLEAMLVSADEPGSGMTDEDVAGNVFTMLLAGEDTTATSLSWMIYLLQRHPDALRQARQEVDAMLPQDIAGWTADDLGCLDYLEACIHESMRLKPVGPFNVVEALKDTVVGDVKIRARTAVVMVMRHDTVDEAVFPQASRFMPERWMGEDSPLAPGHAKRIAMPFGAGPRICPGRYLAMLEIKLVAAMLLRHFDIAVVETPDGRDAQEHMALTMVPVGLAMRVQPRQP